MLEALATLSSELLPPSQHFLGGAPGYLRCAATVAVLRPEAEVALWPHHSPLRYGCSFNRVRPPLLAVRSPALLERQFGRGA
mmetsp:Transcript_10375/g.21960  ORF Transcript_10375/g.21960 Transcript_10375/m.21960 type:complete len:82 (+) Transcript_10375:102-347(+)